MNRFLNPQTSPVSTPYGSIKEWYSPTNTPSGSPSTSHINKTDRQSYKDEEYIDRPAADNTEQQRDRFSNISYEVQRSVSEDQQVDREGNTESSQEAVQSEGSSIPFTKRQIFTLGVLSFSGICSSMFGSLLAPFFPIEAVNKKGISETWVGLIFGSYQLITFLLSPVWGIYLTKIGAKFMYVAGIFVNSSCAILFGCLEWCPPGHIYLIMCLVTRSVEASAAAAIGTASNAVASHTFPNRVSTVMGILSACSCVGLMVGPPLGGFLYEVGGFYLPFAITGGGFMLCGFISWCFLPIPPAEENQRRSQNSIPKWHLFKHPIVTVVGYIAFVGQFAMGFLDVTFTLHLKDVEPSLSQTYIGLIFLIAPVVVIIFAPIIGWVSDKIQSMARFIMVLGIVFAGIGFMGLGPSPFITFLPQYSLAVVLTSLAVAGVGWAALVIAYKEFVTAARALGFPDTLETQGLVSGFYNSYGNLGAFMGPIVGGVMNEKLHFEWSITINAFMVFLSGIGLVMYMICEAICFPNRYKNQRREVTSSPVEGVGIQTERTEIEENCNSNADTQALIGNHSH